MAIKRLKQQKKEKTDKFLKEIGCIAIGTIAGIATYVFCLIIHFDIYGWNFGLVLSPLAAGYAETYFANKYLKETTGAVSAFILFIVTVVYGFIIANPTLGFNIITAGSILIIIQAAIPTAINYFLIVMFLAIISHISGIFKKLYDSFYNIYLKIVNKRGREARPKREILSEDFQIDKEDKDIDNMGILLLTTSHPPQNRKVKEYKGIYEGNIIIQSNQIVELRSEPEAREDYLLSIIKHAKNQALVNLITNLKKDGCDGIINISMSFETLGLQGVDNVLQIAITGTGVVFEDKME